MNIERRRIIFSLDKPGPSSSSASDSSSSSAPYSLTTVLNAREDLPGLYFVEDIGIQIVSYAEATLTFSFTGLIGNFFSVDVKIDSNLVATINLSESYASQPFEFAYGPNTYSGTFPATNGEVNLTA